MRVLLACCLWLSAFAPAAHAAKIRCLIIIPAILSAPDKRAFCVPRRFGVVCLCLFFQRSLPHRAVA